MSKEAEIRYEKVLTRAIGRVKKVIDQFIPGTVITQDTRIFDEGGDFEHELCSTMKEIFIDAANDEYLAYTKKPSARACNSWADGCYGDEWETIRDAIACGQEAASQLLEEEEEEEKDLEN